MYPSGAHIRSREWTRHATTAPPGYPRSYHRTIQTETTNWFAARWCGPCMSTPRGRSRGVFAGLALIVGGLFALGGTAGMVIAAVGLVPLLAGAFDVCIFSALFGGPLRGSGVRACAR